MLQTQPNQTPRLLYNPDVISHTFDYDLNGDDPQQYTVAPLSSIRLPEYLATKFANQLADILVNKRGIRTNYQTDKEKFLKEILI